MIGDQLQTDILGARKAGIDAALLLTGICPELPNNLPFGPTWGITSLEL
jgi:ribonucleotide monophosphatase NagD (HAD superfamily)